MIAIETKCFSSDNTGLLVGKCIHVYRGFFKKTVGLVGSRLLVSVRRKIPFSKFITKKTYPVVLVRAKIWDFRLTGHAVRFFENSFVVLNSDKVYDRIKIRGPISLLIENNYKEISYLTTSKL